MRLKIRSPTGAHVISLEDDATIASLLQEIRQATSISESLEIKYGYPPKVLALNEHPSSTLLSALPVKLQGEQLIVSISGNGAVSAPFSFTGETPKTPAAPLSLTRAAPKFNKDDPPDVRLASGRGTVILRVMEDDNSCLFRALSYVMTRSMMSVEELRQLIAGTIQENQDKYSEAVLEQKPDGYCEWIKMESSWGGGIELEIFASFFEMEITTIDVGTGNVIRFNEGKSKRVIVVYSGIHYDALALSPAGSLVHDSENDELVFDVEDAEIMQAAVELCQKLRKKNYFTDTKNFDLRCNICKTGLKGEKGAIEHATKTGHHDFGEY
ncbi:hypothetical protein EDC01DRAFT_609621 [Geopyxis carbonaria]|nr:hypothetical protein EDC01DRAFT_609621 [Geopyxis carbonaria]